MADLLADIARFRPPEWVLGRAGCGVRFELAAKGDAAEVIALQQRHFPAWKASYEHQLTLPDTVPVARTFTQRVRACWYGWFCTFAAVLGVLAVIDTVSTSTGGIFANAVFAVGVVLWATVTSIVMVRTSS